MLKNNDIIAQLTDGQKVRLLTGVGSLSGKDFKILGIPAVVARNMKDYGRDIFPHSTILSHSWNEDLWYSVAEAKARMIANDGAGLAIVPGAKIKLSPYRREITEDPYLATRFATSHAEAAKEVGFVSALSGYYLTESDAEWMDKEPSKRVINEFFAKPYDKTAVDSGVEAVMTDVRPLSDDYKSYSRYLQDVFPMDKYLVCESAGEENTVDFIARGIICLSASQSTLEAAMARYKKLKQAFERGEGITFDQIYNEQQARTAISDEVVDAAVDRVLEFIKSVNVELPKEEIDASEVAYQATLESTVLLKNVDNILPLSKNKRVALIGNVLPEDENGVSTLKKFKEELVARGYTCSGTEPGYDMTDIHRTMTMDKALSLAEYATTVILFLGFGYENEKDIPRYKSLDLPANQLRLADILVKKNKTVIGVIAAGHAPDIAFTRGFKALLLAPLDVKSSMSALASIISGEVSPSGKLAYTLYGGSHTSFRKNALYKNKFGLKSGPFVGYRYYDTAGLNVGYPFGYGLSYSSFEYSDLVCSGGTVYFTVQNVGDMHADEVAEVYLGLESQKVLRPKKELCGFVKLSLEPGEKTRVALKIDVPTVYHSGSFRTEQGEYTVYVGSSSADIRLSSKIFVRAEVLAPDGEKLRDYIQSIPNVLEDNFTLEAKYYPMKKRPVKNILVGLMSLALAIGLLVFNNSSGLSSVFLSVVAGILAVLAVYFFANDVVERSRNYESETEKLSEKNKEYFAEAEQLNTFSTERMFTDEFDFEGSSDDDGAELVDDAADFEMSEYVNADYKLADVVKELMSFCEERGVRLDAGVAENIIVSLAGSKLLLLDGISSEEFSGLMMMLSEYFGTNTYIDTVNPEAKDSYDFFYEYDNHGDHRKKATVLAIESAVAAKEKLQLLGINGLDAQSFEKFMKPFTTYITSTKENNVIRIYNEQGSNVGYNMSKNLKLILRLADGVTLDMLPASVMRAASYTKVSYVKCKPASLWGVYHGCNRYQLEYIFEKESSAANVSETFYKKIDKLESFVSAHADYKIGNKLWLALEKQIGLFLSAKKEIDEAVDAAVGTKLLPSMLAALRNNLTSEDETLKGTLEFVFGEENVEFSAKLIDSVLEGDKDLKLEATDEAAKAQETAEAVVEEVEQTVETE